LPRIAAGLFLCRPKDLNMQKIKYVYIWEGGECATCSGMSGTEFYDEAGINPCPPIHPHCGCYISVLEIDDNGKAKPTNAKFKNALNKTLKNEGGLTQNIGRKDQPTNMGIKQGTLNTYNKEHPSFNFPDKVDNLTPGQVEQIYKMDYWDNKGFDKINNDRIRDALFDTEVLSGYPRMANQLQETLNMPIDGVMGSNTIGILNNLSPSGASDFMDSFKENRMDHLQNDDKEKWDENKNGWTDRTMRY
jgi:hypothetical protein